MWEYRVTVTLPGLPAVSKRYRTLAKAIKNVRMIIEHPTMPQVAVERVLITEPGA